MSTGTNSAPQPSQSHEPRVYLHVTVTLHGRLAWLLAGIAFGGLRLPDGTLERADHVLKALLNV